MHPTADELAAAKLLVQEEYRGKTWIVLVRVESKTHIVGVWTIAELNKHVSRLIKKYGESFRRAVAAFNDLEFAAYRVGFNVAEDKVEAVQAVKDIMSHETR